MVSQSATKTKKSSQAPERKKIMPAKDIYRIPTTAQIRRLESDWIAKCDPNWGQVLMEVAGRGAAEAAFEVWEQRNEQLSGALKGSVAIFCGRGNNGGDGFVVARYLHLWGVPVHVWVVGNTKGRGAQADQAMTTVESSTNRDILKKLGVDVRSFASDLSSNFFDTPDGKSLSSSVTVIVDALLGTGIDRDVDAVFMHAIEMINGSDATVVSVDLPSGIHSDSGQVMGAAVRAHATVTFGNVKPGLINHPGAEHAGELRVIDIGLPEAAHEKPIIHLASVEMVADLLPKRAANSHKGSFGYLLTIAGSLGMSGATMLATESSLKVGTGLCVLATPSSLVPHLPAREIIYRPIAETDETTIAPKALWELEKDLDKATAVVLGPGLSTNEETVSFVQKFMSKVMDRSNDVPCLIDADGLNCIAENTKVFPEDAKHIVITPHPKELARLLDESTSEIQKDRIASATRAAAEFGCIVVLKGAHTVIADPDGNVFINPTGNPGMSTAGVGDVLSGIIGGLLAQGVEPFDAAVAGAYLHGRAGDLAAHMLGEASVTAGSLVECLPDAIRSIEEELPSDLEVMFEPM
ncbi:MAG: NAD(P)H-hydrate dehydratase [Candidatus Melainabacteria bacterium]|jgi:NAD(P)H-hydrate epimerase|nr:NAD(P)H-hydrate dehydratase [Candidatus Melainabacteria bacterium]